MWVLLIVYLSSGGKPAMTTAEFTTELNCEQAGYSFVTKAGDRWATAKYSCTRK